MSIAAENWTPTLLGDVLRFQAGFPFESRWFTSERVTGGRLVRNRDLRADDQVIYFSGPVPDGYSISNGDVLVGMDGEFEPVLWNKGPALLNQRVGRLVLSSVLHGPFIRYALIKPLAALQGTTGSTTVKHLSHRDVELLTIALPERREQERIADMLLDVDQLLATLDALIEKKRDVAVGVRQALLSGTKRLPGFTQPWEEYPFSRVLRAVNVSLSKLDATEYSSRGALPIVDQGQSRIAGFTDKQLTPLNTDNAGLIVFGDHTCAVKYVTHPFVAGADGTKVLAANAGFDPACVAFAMKTFPIASTGYNRHYSLLKERGFKLPDLVEQHAIAEVLLDLDAEMDALVARRDKTALIKQGMMDELLTGRTRLV